MIGYAKALELAFAGRTISETREANIAYCLVHIGRIDDAKQVAAMALRDRPAVGYALHVMALMSNLLGDTDATYRAIERLVVTEPDSGIWALRDPEFTPLLAERRFRELLAGALGAARQRQARIRERLNA